MFKALGYLSIVMQILTLIPMFKDSPVDTADAMTDVIYDAVVKAIGPKAYKVPKEELKEAVRETVDVIVKSL